MDTEGADERMIKAEGSRMSFRRTTENEMSFSIQKGSVTYTYISARPIS